MELEKIYDTFLHRNTKKYKEFNFLNYDFCREIAHFIDRSCLWVNPYSKIRMKRTFSNQIKCRFNSSSFEEWKTAYDLFVKLLEA